MRELYLYTSLQTIQLKQLIIRMTLFIPRCSASVWGIITINSQKFIIIYKVTHIYFYFVRSLNLWHTSINCNISKISQFKISTNVLNIFPMLYKMYRFLKKENMHFKHESVYILWKKWSNHNFWTGLLYIINYFLWIKKNYNHLYEFHLWKR